MCVNPPMNCAWGYDGETATPWVATPGICERDNGTSATDESLGGWWDFSFLFLMSWENESAMKREEVCMGVWEYGCMDDGCMGMPDYIPMYAGVYTTRITP